MADNRDIQPPPQEPSPEQHGGYPSQAPQHHPQASQGPGAPYGTAPGQGSPYGAPGGAPPQYGAPQASSHTPASQPARVEGGGPPTPHQQSPPQQPPPHGKPPDGAQKSGIRKQLELSESWLGPLATITGVFVSLMALLTQIPSLPGIGALSFAYNSLAPWLYVWRTVLVPVLLVLSVLSFVWALRSYRTRSRSFWRFTASIVLLLLVGTIFLIRPSERIVGVLPYQPTADSLQDPTLGQELADYMRGSLNSPDGLVKALGVSRVPGETLADAAKRIGAQVLVDGSYTLGRNSLETRVTLYDVASGNTLGDTHVRNILRDSENMRASQEEIAGLLGERIDVASAVTRRAYAAGGTDCASAYECYVVGRRYYLWFNADGYNRSIQHYQAAIGLDPEYARAHAGLAEAYLLLANLYYYEGKITETNKLWEDAGKEAQKAVQLGPKLVESRRALAWVYSLKGLKQDAKKEYKEIAKISPPRPGFVLSTTLPLSSVNPSGDAESLWLLGGDIMDADTRVAIFREALLLKPDLPQVHHDLGLVLYAQGKLDEAEAAFKQALTINPNMIYGHITLSEMYFVQAMEMRRSEQSAAGSGQQAAGQETPVIVDPLSIPTPTNASTGTLQVGVAEGSPSPVAQSPAVRTADTYLMLARQHADVALKQMPTLALASYINGAILAAQGSLQPAIRTARSSLEANPEIGAWYQYSVYDDPNMYLIYISAFRQAIAALPEYVYNYNYLGKLYVAQGHTYEALRAYQDAVTLDPHFGVAWFNLSTMQRWLGQDEEAVASARRAVSETVNWNVAYSQLGQALLQQADSRRPDLVASVSEMITTTEAPAITPSVPLPTPLTEPPTPEGCAEVAREPQADVSDLYAEAESVLLKAIELNPRDTTARITLGKVYYGQAKLAESRGNAEESEARLDAARKQLEQVDPEVNEFDSQTHYLLGLLYWHEALAAGAENGEEKLKQAEDKLYQAFTIDPTNGTIYDAYLQYLQQQKPEEADKLDQTRLDLFAAQAAEHPRSPTYRRSLAELYRRAGKVEEAEQQLDTAISIDPTSPDLHNEFGIFYYIEGDYEQAMEQFEVAAELAPSEPVYKGNIGDAAKELGKRTAEEGDAEAAKAYYQVALDSYRAAAELSTTNDYHVQIGDIYLAQERYIQAGLEYSRAKSGQDEAYDRLGDAFAEKENHAEAITAYKRAICLNPTAPAYYADIARVYRAMDNPQEAVKQLQTALAISPADGSLHNLLGIVYGDDLERPEDAIEEYKLAVALDPEEVLYRTNLAHTYYIGEEYGPAAEQFQAAYDVSDDEDIDRWSYAYYLGLCHTELEEYAEAQTALEEATRLNPEHPDANAWLAFAYNAQGDPRACETMSQAVRLAQQSTDEEVRKSAETYISVRDQWGCTAE